MKPNVSAQIEFIKQCLRKGQQRKDILPKFTQTYNLETKTFDNRLKCAKKALQVEISAIKVKTEQRVQSEVETRTLRIMSVAQRIDTMLKDVEIMDLKLASNIVIEKVVTEKGIIVVKRELSPHEISVLSKTRRDLIAEINKMGGNYEPMRTQTEMVISNKPKQIFKIGTNTIEF